MPVLIIFIVIAAGVVVGGVLAHGPGGAGGPGARRRQWVELTRNPVGLIHALPTLQRNDTPLASSLHAVAAICIEDPGRHHAGRLQRLYDTHPTLDSRIAVLQQLAQGTRCS